MCQRTTHRDRFVLRGGVLLAVLDERRPTRIVDLAGLHLDNTIENLTDTEPLTWDPTARSWR